MTIRESTDVPLGNAVAGPRPDFIIILSMNDMFVSVKAFLALRPVMKSSIFTRSLRNKKHLSCEAGQPIASTHTHCQARECLLVISLGFSCTDILSRLDLICSDTSDSLLNYLAG